MDMDMNDRAGPRAEHVSSCLCLYPETTQAAGHHGPFLHLHRGPLLSRVLE